VFLAAETEHVIIRKWNELAFGGITPAIDDHRPRRGVSFGTPQEPFRADAITPTGWHSDYNII
jgi:hypothetical protein